MVAESPIVADGTLGTGFDSDLSDLFSEDIRACFLGQKDPAAALADAEKQWNARIAKGA